MRGLVVFLILAIALASFSFAYASLGDFKNKVSGFSAFTSAVCENQKNFVYCRDEVFVNCNGKISKASGMAECNGFKLEIPKVTGEAVFGNDWKDPRIEN